MINYYEILGIKETSTTEEIKIAYKQMAKKYHPDINKNVEASKIMANLNEAKETLLDTEKREEYDNILHEIRYSKQFSKVKEERYSTYVRIYKENYKNITKLEYYFDYLKNSTDKLLIKFIKSILVLINALLFICLKGIFLGLVFFLYLIGEFVDYFAGFLMLMAVLSLVVYAGETTPDYIPFIPANVENFCFFSIIATVLEMLKLFILESSLNIYVLINDIEDKIFIYIIDK